ncbi:MAG: hypothetical protein JWL75_407 [Parcubacteria group bacterium]|nr:hypothetical protein [Parcubacteria group bacterium]
MWIGFGVAVFMAILYVVLSYNWVSLPFLSSVTHTDLVKRGFISSIRQPRGNCIEVTITHEVGTNEVREFPQDEEISYLRGLFTTTIHFRPGQEIPALECPVTVVCTRRLYFPTLTYYPRARNWVTRWDRRTA